MQTRWTHAAICEVNDWRRRPKCVRPSCHRDVVPFLPASYLNQHFYNWLQRNPEFNVRAVLPIVENGNTVLIHVWFD